MPDHHQHIDLDVLHQVERLLSAASDGTALRRDDHATLAPDDTSLTLRENDAVTPLPRRR